MNLDLLLNLAQIIALVVVPIWLLHKLSTANELLSARMDEIGRLLAQTAEQLSSLTAEVQSHAETLAIQKGIRMGIEEAERRR
jgi:hypothetical protein